MGSKRFTRLKVNHILYNPKYTEEGNRTEGLLRIRVILPPPTTDKNRRMRESRIRKIRRLGGVDAHGNQIRETGWKAEFVTPALEPRPAFATLTRTDAKPLDDYDVLVKRRDSYTELIGSSTYIEGNIGICGFTSGLDEEHIVVKCPPEVDV